MEASREPKSRIPDTKADEVFVIEGDDIRPLQSRPFKAGLFGKNLEDALQTLIEQPFERGNLSGAVPRRSRLLAAAS